MNLFVHICFVVICASAGAAFKAMGPPGTIEVGSITACEEKSDLFVFEPELKTIDSKGTKALSGKSTNKIALDDTITYKIDVRKWENSGWNPQFNHEGKFCEDTKKFTPKLWEKFKKAVKPELPTSCPVKPGTYTMEKVQAETGDFNIPTIFYGKMRVELKLFDKDKKLVLCSILEGNSQAPM